MRAVDVHVHLPIPEWVDGSLGPYRRSAERYFRREIVLQTVEELAAAYEAIDCVGVLLGWDAETATGRPRLPNDLVAKIVDRHPGRFIGLAGIDPWKGAAARTRRSSPPTRSCTSGASACRRRRSPGSRATTPCACSTWRRRGRAG